MADMSAKSTGIRHRAPSPEYFCLAPDNVLAAPAHEQMQSKRWKQEELLQLAGTGGGQVPPAPLWLASVGSRRSFSHDVQRQGAEVRGKFLLTLT